MSEHDVLLETLDDGDVLSAIRWAYDSATARVLEDYSEAAGHDAAWVGFTRWTLFRDRLDRVFACRKYAVSDGADGRLSLDVLQGELSAHDIATMPQIAPGTVVRSDLNGSPGWSFSGTRWLLASVVFGRLNEHRWPRKSATKQFVARQPAPDTEHPTLFDDFAAEERGGLVALSEAVGQDSVTLVVGHTLAVDHGGRELVIGQPRFNLDGGPAWHWTHDLLQSPLPDGGRVRPAGPTPVTSDAVPDAPVKLRTSAAASNQAGGAR